MTAEELRRACITFEEEHGVEAFLDALALIMQDRLKLHGLEIEFADDLWCQPPDQQSNASSA
jgi:hypothetical protein